MENIVKGVLPTGLNQCYDSYGKTAPCEQSGQDAEYQTGITLRENRYEKQGEFVFDTLTGLYWTANANPAEFPMTWTEALTHIDKMNNEQAYGFSDWRMPNRIELRSLVDLGVTRPVVTQESSFYNLEQSWYWTSTTAVISPAHAWYVEMSGGRMFYGHKNQFFLLWPVRGKGRGVLRQSGQSTCFDSSGKRIPCMTTGQDGETRYGTDWPASRFEVNDDMVRDRLTGLAWHKQANLSGVPVTWNEAFEAISHLNKTMNKNWRLPNINELESLVDCDQHSPALPKEHGFSDLRDTYWSSTTSLYEPHWSFALYLDKGAIGVGHKHAAKFYVWPVSTPD